jgi:nucleoside-diphosphate-sugar epimerase
MKVLITGASGFVGGSLWRAALASGHHVTAVGRRPLASPGYHSIDLAQGMPLETEPDVVVHAAARSSPWGTRREFYSQNVEATQQVVEFCRRRGAPHLVFISTGAVMYENRHQFALDEETPLPSRAINTYARTKREAESIIEAYPGPWTIVRPRAVFGPGDTVVFPRILHAARAGRLPRIGSSQPVVGDLIYIDTLVEYILRIMERRSTGLYILTNNQPVPILDFLGDVLSRLGLPVPQKRVPVGRAMRAAALIEGVYSLLPFLGEPPLTRFGVSVFAYSKTFRVTKALRDLGAPSVSLAEGVNRFVAWQRSQT